MPRLSRREDDRGSPGIGVTFLRKQESGSDTPASQRALRVLHVTPHYAPAWSYGGLVEAVFHLTRHLACAGACVRVLTTDANGEHRRLPPRARAQYSGAFGVEAIYCARRAAKSVAPAMLARLPAMVRWADLVHLHAAYSFPSIPTLAAARLAGRPVVWTPHGALQRWPGSRRVKLKSLWEKISGAIAPRRWTLHLTSRDEARECADRFPNAARIIVPNGVEIPERAVRLESADRLRIGFIGRLDPKKGIENLLEACVLLAERGRISFSLAIAGSGAPAYERRLSVRVAALSARIDVLMSGDVRDDAKERWFADRDVIVAPSFTENFGIVIAEALAREVPVIASHGTPWAELETHGCGLWVANDAASLAAALERIAVMPRAAMGARGRAWMIDKFSWERCARDMMRCYRDLLGRCDGPRESAIARAPGAL
ncbi:MAG TPA: glycosyltransferase [Candidatus Binataceae bacterium]|nr:glycosyltransferase [Candidatus Binataceae bacterium]